MTRRVDEQAELIFAFQEGRCPDCGGRQIIPGPRGGLSQNLTCGGCGSRFNVAKYQGQVFFAERLDTPGPGERVH
jgi:ribosomal protein S27E